MVVGAIARPLGGPAPFLAIEPESENLSIPVGAVLCESSQCAACARNPLAGEQVTVYRNGAGDAYLCDQCVWSPACAALGEPIRRERVRTTAGALSVRRAR
jgi:hypothetical protein